MLAGCASTPIPADPLECCKRLKTRDLTLKKFERLCIGLVFLEGRFGHDPNAARNIRAALETCKYVYGVEE
jgi:hypothetical protein